MIVVHLDRCSSTQTEVRARLAVRSGVVCIAVSAAAQRQGRGRGGRDWQNPAGDGLMVSIGRRGPMPVAVLNELPRCVADVVIEALRSQVGERVEQIAWKAPNDLVAGDGSGKLAGILVDARTTGDQVDEIVVGIGINLAGPAFVTTDGQVATSVEAASGVRPARDALRTAIVLGVGGHLEAQ